MNKNKNKNEAGLNKKPAFEADSSESQYDMVKSVLTANYSLADQGIIGNQKTFNNVKALESSNLEQDSGLSSYYQYSKPRIFVKSFSVDSQKAVEVEGIEPSGF